MQSLVVAIDFDGCIAYYDGWRGVDVFGKILPGAIEALKAIRSAGHRIIIWTCRQNTQALFDYLVRSGVPFDAINTNPWDKVVDPTPGECRKIPADVYIDDRGVSFRGDWSKIPELINNFVTWVPHRSMEIKGG